MSAGEETMREGATWPSASPTVCERSDGGLGSAGPVSQEDLSSLTVVEGSDGCLESPTLRDVPGKGGTQPLRPRLNLPDEVTTRYSFVRDFAMRGGESDIALLRDRETGEEVVFKCYRPGISPDRIAIEALRMADDQHVARIIDYRDGAEGAWEIQEYYPLGSLRDLLDSRPLLPELERRAIVSEVSDALAHIQSLGGGVAHRDIKPANILVRGNNPLDLVLTDFGLAQVQHGLTHLTSAAQGTWLYAAPEVHDRAASPRSDWFSLGAIVYELCTGRKLFSDADGAPLNDHDAMAACVKGSYDSRLVEDERWRLLVDGLTTYDREKRWGYEEVSAWLAGESPAVYRTNEEGAPGTTYQASFAYQPGWFSGLVHNPVEYAQALRENWKEAAADWMGRPDEAVMQFMAAFGLENEARLLLRRGEHPDAKFIRLQVLLDPDGEVVFKGFPLTDESLRLQIERCQQRDEDARTWLMAVYESEALNALVEATDDRTLAAAAYWLRRWKGQANRVIQLVPEDKKDFVSRVMSVEIGELFVSAFERAGEQSAGK